ncbi:hypothetical protein BD779DRAFT_1802856 [Infundibulicybe gibba]|nr:hypothetical protein BD779DRAFT_1802856 [Infundibulicybe gibba]
MPGPIMRHADEWASTPGSSESPPGSPVPIYSHSAEEYDDDDDDDSGDDDNSSDDGDSEDGVDSEDDSEDSDGSEDGDDSDSDEPIPGDVLEKFSDLGTDFADSKASTAGLEADTARLEASTSSLKADMARLEASIASLKADTVKLWEKLRSVKTGVVVATLVDKIVDFTTDQAFLDENREEVEEKLKNVIKEIIGDTSLE